MQKAHYELLEDGTYYGRIPGIRGVWANEKGLRKCREELKSVLEDWIVFTLNDGGKVPGLTTGLDKRHLIKHA